MNKSYLVTGGTGFLGSAVVRALVRAGYAVRVLDNNFRGAKEKLREAEKKIEFIEGDVRDAGTVTRAAKGVRGILHFAFINGTEYFYTKPDLVLDVGIRGMLSVLEACATHKTEELFVASSSEVYQTPPKIPTPEDVPMSIPDPLNPRYSYAAGKILSEILALHGGLRELKRLVLFRPHNVYGPDMGFEHVVPEFVLRMKELKGNGGGKIKFPIQGSGEETRAFVFVDDFVQGLMRLMEKGEHRGIYNIGNDEELSIRAVAEEVGRFFDVSVEVVPGKIQPGSVKRRCPDISKLRALGYEPKVPFKEGLPIAARWYVENADRGGG